MRTDRMKHILTALVAVSALALPLAGCGGGGGGGTSSGPDTIHGTVIDPSNGGTSTQGDIVWFDDKSAVNATVGSNGTYTLTVPESDITGNDALWIFNSAGTVLLDEETIQMGAGGGNTVPATTTLPTVPPTQPPLIRRPS